MVTRRLTSSLRSTSRTFCISSGFLVGLVREVRRIDPPRRLMALTDSMVSGKKRLVRRQRLTGACRAPAGGKRRAALVVVESVGPGGRYSGGNEGPKS